MGCMRGVVGVLASVEEEAAGIGVGWHVCTLVMMGDSVVRVVSGGLGVAAAEEFFGRRGRGM